MQGPTDNTAPGSGGGGGGGGGDGNNGDDDIGALPMPPLGEIDWEAMMRDMAPPEWDLLLSATAKNQLEKVRDMVERQGVPVGHSNGIGQTSLHIAALWGHIDLARYLVQFGADVNAANLLTGATPLHAALCSNKITPEQQAAMAQLLVVQGNADPLIEDKFGKAPLEYLFSERNMHPLFKQPHYAALVKKMSPPAPGLDRFRAGFMRSVLNDQPTCSKIG